MTDTQERVQHTPGPWICEIGVQCYFHDGNRVSINRRNPEEDTGEPVAEVWPTSDESDIADGYLIAAAPELLEALQAAYVALTDGMRRDERDAMMRQVRAAIAKAEGR
jgi:hypothetical protein